MSTFQELFDLHDGIGYVALYSNGKIDTSQRPGIPYQSSGNSDYYEEFLVNTTLLKFATQRGRIDCGGLEFVVVGYGNFNQLVMPVRDDAHISICFEKSAEPIGFAQTIKTIAGNSTEFANPKAATATFAQPGRGEL